jgi:hypothetical protein
MKRAQGLVDLVRVLIGAPGPKESFQPVSLAARNDVNVEMRDALADAIVDGHEGSFGVHPLHDGAGKKLDIQKERADQIIGQVRKRLKVALYDEEAMAGEKRAMIQKCERELVFKNFVAGNAAADDVAERAVLFEPGNKFHWGIGAPRAGRGSRERNAAD